MNSCHICLQQCNPSETLCNVCRETIGRLAGIWREQPNLRAGAILLPATAGQSGAIASAAAKPRRRHFRSRIGAFFFRLACMLHLAPQAEAQGPSHAVQRNL